MRFSIVTVTFRAEHTFPRTAQSVMEQDYADVEHLIIDGGSNDGTRRLIEQYEHDSNSGQGHGHSVRWLSEPDKGIYDAMNKGLRMATGQYVCFLNAGDKFPSPHTLSEIARKAAEAQSADQAWPAVLYGDTNIVDDDGRYLGPRHLTPPDVLTWRSFLQGMLVCHQAFYARTDLAQAAPYDLSYRFSADVDWCIRVMRLADEKGLRLLHLHQPVVDYLNEGQTTKNHRASLKERFRVMAHHYGLGRALAMHAWFVVRAVLRKLK